MDEKFKEYVSKEAKEFRDKKELEYERGLIPSEDFWLIKRIRRVFNERRKPNRKKRNA